MRTPRFLLLAAALVALAACSRPQAPQEPIRSVKLLTVGEGKVSTRSEYAGEVRARTESRLGFRVGGKLVQRPAEVGQRVKAGQLLAQLDAQDLALSSQAAQAQVSAAQTQRDLAAADLKRYQDLLSRGFVSGAEIERPSGHAPVGRGEFAPGQGTGCRAGQPGWLRAFAGRWRWRGVLAVEAEVGQVVGAGAPVVRLARDGARDVVIAVPEDRVGQIQAGSNAQVRLWAGAGGAGANPMPLNAVVREVAASADAATRTYQVKLALPDGATAPLGATAYVTLEPSASQSAAGPVIKLPTSALMRFHRGRPVGDSGVGVRRRGGHGGNRDRWWWRVRTATTW